METAIATARLLALRGGWTPEQDALLVAGPENRRYLSGFTARDEILTESSGMLLVTREKAFLLTDFRYLEWARQEALGLEVVMYSHSLGATLAGLLQDAGVRVLGFEETYLTYRQYQRFSQAVAEAGLSVDWQPVSGMVEALRETKAPEEVAAIRRALALTEEALQEVARSLAPGQTEGEVAWKIERLLREKGAEGLAFPPIVAGGPNSARPHHQPGDYRLQEGEPIIIDMGARVAGYCADLTRTFVLGPPDEHFRKIYTLVRQAQDKAEQELRAGLDSRDGDALAREVIAAAGYGEAFGHSLGHGVGLAVHEAPSLSPHKDRATTLLAGSIVTVEPGIYLTGWGGVRLEDMALLHEDRAEVLTEIGFYEW
ncbi:MAG: aminopeptidase P family protein [Syntrophales bacterium]|nr:aminopeptidase P family protein [Syntrophales bacterium]MDD5641809.1 aminopeptidase P family protein [Syntrophales bacterium]